MIFHEMYGEYYNTVATILRGALEVPVDRLDIARISEEMAFLESSMKIENKLIANGDWPLLDEAGYSILKHAPEMPLSNLQKRWLKTLLLDPRIKLFLDDDKKLTGIKPLFHPKDIVYYDQCADGDPYEDDDYVNNFKTILEAIKEGKKVTFEYPLKNGQVERKYCNPYRLEYSLKDDRFRLIATSKKSVFTYLVSKMSHCKKMTESVPEDLKTVIHKKREVELEIWDERQALERAMLQFSHYEKITERLDDGTYRFILKYEEEDEIEILIRILSFGPNVRVLGPDRFVNQIKQRLINQKSCEQ